jgi:hypothetical protein
MIDKSRMGRTMLEDDLIMISSVTVNGITIELVKEKDEDPLGLPYTLRTRPNIMTGDDPCFFGQHWKARRHFHKIVNRVSPNAIGDRNE